MTQTLTRSHARPNRGSLGSLSVSAAVFSCLSLGYVASADAQQPAPSPPVSAGAAATVTPAYPYPAGDPAAAGYQPAPGQPYAQPYPQGYPQGYPQQPYTQPGYPYSPYPYGAMPARPQRVLKGYEVRRPHWPLMIAGISVLGGSYLITAGVTGLVQSTDCAVNSSRSSCTTSGTYWPMYIPVVGPFIEMSYLSGSSTILYPALVFSGLAQTAGMALIIAGGIVPRRVAVYDEPKLSLAPYTLPGGGGLVASGRF